MADKLNKNYKISGAGVLNIDGDSIVISVEDKGDFNLANVLADLNECSVKFSFSYDEDYEDTVKVDTETGESLFGCQFSKPLSVFSSDVTNFTKYFYSFFRGVRMRKKVALTITIVNDREIPQFVEGNLVF